jgi:hypothetical protein
MTDVSDWSLAKLASLNRLDITSSIYITGDTHEMPTVVIFRIKTFQISVIQGISTAMVCAPFPYF